MPMPYWLAALLAAALLLMVVMLLRRRSSAEAPSVTVLREELRLAREEAAGHARQLREEVSAAQRSGGEMLVATVNTLGEHQKALLDGLSRAMQETTATLRTELGTQRNEQQAALQAMQSANEARFEQVRSTVAEQLNLLLEAQRKQLSEVVASINALTDSNRRDQQAGREALDQKFLQIQASNEKKLDEMRQTVDEKLQGTLEKRLGESFKQVSERLEAVQRGLGEMKSLADGVGDLKRVLTNVKERGTWGEYQLAAILEQILTPDQYAANVRPKAGGEVVEFAVKLPGRSEDADMPVWLPIDAKFPREDYERLLVASESADIEGVRVASAALTAALRKAARDIHDKYIAPPATTDFAVLFLPTEGLYAEVLRQPGLHDELQSKYRVLTAGPTTLAAILNSLRVGFQTLAIEQRSHEVWRVLGAVKLEFNKFGQVLDKVKKQLNTASNTIDETQTRTRVMQRKLKSVEQLPSIEAQALLGVATVEDVAEDDESEAGDES